MNTNILSVTAASAVEQVSNGYQNDHQVAETDNRMLPALPEAAATIHVFYDAIANDFCATCQAFDGLVSWGSSPEDAQRKVQQDLQRFCRQAAEEAHCAAALWV